MPCAVLALHMSTMHCRNGSQSIAGAARSTWWPRSASTAAVVAVAAACSGCSGAPFHGCVQNAIRSRPGSRKHSSRYECSGAGSSVGSPGSGPCSASSSAAESRTLRETANRTAQPDSGSPASGPNEMRPRDGFSPTTPQQAAGMRIEPPPSDASAIGTMPAPDRGAAAAGRAAGHVLLRPRRAGRPAHRRLGGAHDAPLRRGRPAHRHQPGVLEALDQPGVGRHHPARRQTAAVLADAPRLAVVEVLEQKRHAAERPVVRVGVGRRRRCGPRTARSPRRAGR